MITAVLSFGNLVLASVNVIVGFSLFVYVLTYNRKSPVAQAFCALMAFVTVVYLVDVGMTEVSSLEAANFWLRAQWIGIAFVPAADLHFSSAVLRTTGARSRALGVGVVVSYVLGGIALGLVWLTDWIVADAILTDGIYHLAAGAGFLVFLVYYVLTALVGWINIRRARGRTLTSASRRRMSYLMIAFLAPSVGVFPYLLIPSMSDVFSMGFLLLLTLVGNLAIALMTILIAYTVAYQGVLLPDRVVKHNLVHFLLRGPLVAAIVIAIMLAIPRVDSILGLPRDTVLVVAVAGSVVLLQLLVNLAKPGIDRVIYRGDRNEIAWIQALDRRLLTTADLEQLLDNTLAAICDLLQAPAGFVVTVYDSEPSLCVFCGPRQAASEFLSTVSMPALLNSMQESRKDEFVSNEDMVQADGHWVLPLRGHRDALTLGVLGVQATSEQPGYTEEEMDAIYGLVRQAELALEDMRLQQHVFGILQTMDQELDQIQAWRSQPVYMKSGALQHAAANPVDSEGFAQAVKDALSQYWGGPKLSRSPLVRMRVVRSRLGANDGVPTKAVRSALQESIDRLRPNGERSLTSNEWVVFNILDLRFVQGLKIRDVARRLVMSESDYYRKQRVAIEQVSEVLAQMERSEAGTELARSG